MWHHVRKTTRFSNGARFNVKKHFHNKEKFNQKHISLLFVLSILNRYSEIDFPDPKKLGVLKETVCFQVPQRTTSISPALVRKNSPGNGPGLGPRAGAHLIRASNPDLRRTDISMETPLKRASSGSSSSSSTPSSQGGSNERGECWVFVPSPDVLHLQIGLWVPKEKT
ncbi:hypothetical protein XENORESO_019266, partial [Xenotaenia resolanae]